MRNKIRGLILFTVLALSLGGCSVFKQNTYKINFNYKPLNAPFDMTGEINGAGLKDLGRDLAWVVNNLKEKLQK